MSVFFRNAPVCIVCPALQDKIDVYTLNINLRVYRF